MNIRPFRSNDRDDLVRLWRDCGLVVAHNSPWRDIERKLRQRPDWLIVGEAGGCLIASCMVGYDGHRGWINYLAVHPDQQRKGIGRQLMDHAEGLLREAGCPKINLQIRATNSAVVTFYESLGFKQDPVVSMGKRLESDEGWEG